MWCARRTDFCIVMSYLLVSPVLSCTGLPASLDIEVASIGIDIP